MTAAEDTQTPDWKEEISKKNSIYQRIVDWILQEPYTKRELQKELAYVEKHLEYNKNLPGDYYSRHDNTQDLLELATHYHHQADIALKYNDYLEFSQYISNTDRVLLYHLLKYEKLTGNTPNWLELRKLSLEYRVLSEDSQLTLEESSPLLKLHSEEELSIEDWVELHRDIHRKKINEYKKEKIQQAKSHKKIRHLAIATVLTLGTGLAITLGILAPANIPLFPSVNPPEFLIENNTLLIFAALFGLLGAIISDLTKYAGNRKITNSDEERSAIYGFWVTAARYTFGATSAVIFLIILYSEILPVIDTAELTERLALVLAFAAGFSERLVIRAMEEISL